MIRKMCVEDLDVILKLEQQLFSSCWTYDMFYQEITSNEFAHLFVYEVEGEIIGYYGLWILFEQAQITTIGIKPSFQGKGFSKVLMDDLIQRAIDVACEFISLEVRISNFKAIQLYKKYGFEVVNIRKNYYQDNYEDAYLMVKAIGGLS